jgi:hypothetical protein
VVVVRTDDVVVDKQTDSVVVDESLSLSHCSFLSIFLSHMVVVRTMWWWWWIDAKIGNEKERRMRCGL